MMKFEINSPSIIFNGKNVKPFFEKINAACEACQVTYFVVGAFARDIVLQNIFNQPTGIATKDIDVAIRIDSWESYSNFIGYLKSHYQFTEGQNPHEFISSDGVFTDIIPYGSIEQHRVVSFPPNFDREINMLGFQEVYKSTILISLDEEIEFQVASIEGIAILKLIAWKDRQPDRISGKHTRDIGLIISAYFDALVAEFATDFPDLFDEPDFDPNICGARALGRRIKQLTSSSPYLIEELNRLFSFMIKDEDNALFINQLTNSSYWDYSLALRIIKSLILGFKE